MKETPFELALAFLDDEQLRLLFDKITDQANWARLLWPGFEASISIRALAAINLEVERRSDLAVTSDG